MQKSFITRSVMFGATKSSTVKPCSAAKTMKSFAAASGSPEVLLHPIDAVRDLALGVLHALPRGVRDDAVATLPWKNGSLSKSGP
ncbi:hypothetical protein [Mangrovicoccus ximenensis]|uniref:hypothetical protein n=1 Tax=Mangrovicoccus ximenensis TaxID=1911570 RepID=UPI0011AE6F4A|nr:hypothetical protein [Mangrovicoccus ximenensis]